MGRVCFWVGSVIISGLLVSPQLLPGQTSARIEFDLETAPVEPEQAASGLFDLAAPGTGDGEPVGSPPEKTKPRRLRYKKSGGVVYRKTPEYEIKCDVYVPEGEGPFPAVIAVHGGAWRQGSKLTMRRHAKRMAQAGYVVVAINYRHAPRYPFPAQVHDCKHAVRWTKSNAQKYKIDPLRVGAFGYSAGGHLVAMLGTTDAADGLEGEIVEGLGEFDSRVKAVAAGGTPGEFSWINGDSPVLGYWLGGTRNQFPQTYRAASPTSFVSPDDPPFFLFHGDSDLLVPQTSPLKLHELLLKFGVPSQLSISPGDGHLTTFSDIGWMDRSIEFFDIHLKND